MPHQMVREITLDASGRANGCVVIDADGRERHEPADLVCVACSAVESARLLLLSTSARFPDGIGNGQGLVGRHLQFHAVTMAHGRLAAESMSDPERASDHPFLGRSVADHYALPSGISTIDKGGILRFNLPATAELDPPTGSRMVGFEVFHDFIPNEHTRVTLDPKVRDRFGLPVARIHLDLPSHHRTAGRWLLDRGLELLDDLGAADFQVTDIGGTSSYLVHGTCRAGTDPETSVLDSFCRIHEVPNLYVVDGSFMPTSGGASPTLTILANSLRTADHLIHRARHGHFD
jgi:choline dehydrogenase-like flavoprotein